MMYISDKLFSHIHNDAHLVGTKSLEGMEFDQTISFLLDYVQACKKGRVKNNIDKIDKQLDPLLDKLVLLKQNTRRANKISLALKGYTVNEVSDQIEFLDYAGELFEQIRQLSSLDFTHDLKSILMPGGWQNRSGGHALVYEFLMEDNGDLLFIIHNTGAGLNYHQKIQGLDKERFCPIKAYRIPKDEIIKEKMIWFLGELIKPRLVLYDESNFTAERLYTEVFPKVAYLNGEEVDAFQHTRQDNLTAGQHSGTCTEKCLHQMVENALPNKKSYKQFIYGLKRYVLEHYIEQLKKENRIDIPSVSNQVSLAIENTARLLLKEDYFDPKTRREETEFLLNLQEQLVSKVLPYNPNLNARQLEKGMNELEDREDEYKAWSIAYPSSTAKPEWTTSPSIKHRKKINQNVYFNFETENLIDEIDKYVDQVNDLSEDPIAVVSSLEDFFLNFPISPHHNYHFITHEFYQNLDLSQKNDFLMKIEALKDLHTKAYKEVYAENISPSYGVTQLSYIAILASLNDHALSDEVSYLEIIQAAITDSLKEELTNPFWGSENYACDSRLVQLRKLLINDKINPHQLSAKTKAYFEQLIKSHDLWERLEAFYGPYCEVMNLTEREQVCERGKQDIRVLFLVHKYLSSDSTEKQMFISELCHVHDLDRNQKEALQFSMDALEAELYFIQKLDALIVKPWAEIGNIQVDSRNTPFEIVNRGYSSDPVSTVLLSTLVPSKLQNPTTVIWPDNNIIKLILDNNLLNSNQIQMTEFVPREYRKSKDIKWIREFLHLRTSSLQLVATIDFFNQHLHYLQDLDKQIYLEKNIFQPSLLQEALEEDPILIDKLKRFIQFGTQAFSVSGKPDLTALFFMKLDLKIIIYQREYYKERLKLMDPNAEEDKEVEPIIVNLNHRLQEKFDSVDQLLNLESTTPKMRYRLIIQKVLILTEFLKQTPNDNQKQELLKSFFATILDMNHYDINRRQEIENLIDRSSIDHSLRILQLTFNDLQVKNSEKAIDIILEVALEYLSKNSTHFKQIIESNHLSWEIDLPFITFFDESTQDRVEICSLDINLGRISKPGLDRAWLPESIRNEPTYKMLLGNFDPVTLANREESYFEFEYEHVPYRIIKDELSTWSIQRQFNVLNQGNRWYQAYDIQSLVDLPTIMKEANYLAWISVNDTNELVDHPGQILIAQPSSNRLMFCYQASNQELIKLNDNNLDSGERVLKQGSFLHDLVANFEDPQFVIALAGPNGYQIELPRYEITLEVKKCRALTDQDVEEVHWEVSLADSPYRLDLSRSQSMIPGLKSSLAFISDSDQKVLIPIQQFVAAAELESMEAIEVPSMLYGRNSSKHTLTPSTKRFYNEIEINTGAHSENDIKKREFGKSVPILDDPTKKFDKKPKKKQNQVPLKKRDKLTKQIQSAEIQETMELFNPEDQTEYYLLTQDIGNYLIQDYFGKKPTSTKDSQHIILEQYKGCEHYIEFSTENNQFYPKNMEDGLYLAYVYLCNRQPGKAMETLQYCESHFGELSGTSNVFDYILWFLFSAPAQFENSTIKANIEAPDYLAVQLKALSFLAAFKRDNPGFTVEGATKISEKSYRKRYEAMLVENRQIFYNNLDNNIYALYHKYHHTESNVSQALKLSDHDKLNLLRTVYINKNRIVEGPLGVVWRRLEVKTLNAELSTLKEKASHYVGLVPENLSKAIMSLEIQLQKVKPILAVHSQLKTTSIQLDVPKTIHWYFEPLSVRNIAELNSKVTDHLTKNKHHDLKIQELLTFPINEELFILELPRLFDAVYHHELNELDETALLEFCIQTMKAYHQTSNDNIKSNLPALSAVLYSFIQNIEYIKDLENKSDQKRDKDKKVPHNGYMTYQSLKKLDVWMNQILDVLSSAPNPRIELDVALTMNELRGESDVQEALTTVRALAQEEQTQVKPKVPISLLPISVPNNSIQTKIAQKCGLNEFYNLLESYHVQHLDVMENIKSTFEESDAHYDFFKRSQIQLELDTQAGLEIHTLQQKEQSLAVEHLGNKEVRRSIHQVSKKMEMDLEAQCDELLDELIAFANQQFNADLESGVHTDLILAVMGQKLEKLKLKDLLKLYLTNDLLETKSATRLQEDQCEDLHAKIGEYLTVSIQKNQWSKICDTIEKQGTIHDKDINLHSSAQEKQAIGLIGKLIAETNQVAHHQSPELTLFQYDQKILIRKQQKEIIESLLEHNSETGDFYDKIIQLIMGGGKSKVLLPLLALKKATGENLSIIEVPETLYKTNLADLNSVSLRLFGQHALGLQFDRNTPSDSENLKRLYRKLKYTSVSRGYVITTRESMAALDLKYHELLSNVPESNREEWEKQIKWLDRIIQFRAHRGDVLVDEVDTSLDIRKQINFTVGNLQTIPERHIQAVIELYQFLDQIPYEEGTLLGLALKPDLLTNEKIAYIRERLACELIYNQQSPLYPYLPSNVTQQDQSELVQYLLNQADVIPESLLKLSDPDGQFTIKFLKGEINHLLPHTLSLKLFENYGPSHDSTKNLLQRAVSIPYGGNNEPKEMSKDINHLKTLNLTVQSNLISGISPLLIESLLNDWIKTAKAELLDDPDLGSLDNTPTGSVINQVIENVGLNQQLSKINLEDCSSMEHLYAKLQHNWTFIFFILKENILPNIEIDNKVLTHNPHKHVNMYRSFQGITGTPWNWQTMHQRIRFDPTSSLGTDGLTLARLKDKKTSVQTAYFENTQSFLNQTLEMMKKPENLRAIIDVGASFRGINNVEVAMALTDFLIGYNKQFNATIKYILYFDKNPTTGMEEPYALSVANPKERPHSLKGKNAFDIEQLLHCKPNDCFTYYDQKHTIGADFKQAQNAVALVTVDKSTLKKDLLQGVMRMRGFENSQEVEIVISNETHQALMMNDSDVTIDDIISFTDFSQNKRLVQDHFAAALQKMKNLIVHDLKTKILKVDSKQAFEKAQLHQIFEPFFMESVSDNFIDAYGALEIEQETTELFNQHTKRLLHDWTQLLSDANLPPETEEKHQMLQAFNQLQDEALRICNSSYLHTMQLSPDQTTESQQETRAQQQQDKMQQLEVEESYFDARANCHKPLYWTDNTTIDELIHIEPSSTFETQYWDMAGNCQRKELKVASMPLFVKNPNVRSRLAYELEEVENELPTSQFDKALFRSYNFYKTEKFDEPEIISAEHQKQVHAVLMIQTEHALKAIILTYPEAEHVKELLNQSELKSPNYIWLTNTQETVLGGENPTKENLNTDYNKLLQQLRFYNGDLKMLLNQDLSGSWLMESFQEKMRYFEENLLPYRFTDKNKFNQLKNMMEMLQEAYETVGNLSLTELSTFRVARTFPEFNRAAVRSLEEFVAFCQELHKGNRTNLSDQDIQSFHRPFYFKILCKDGDEIRFTHYINSIDDETLFDLLEQELREMQIRHDYESLSRLCENQAFINNPAKSAILTEALIPSLANPRFFKNLYTEATPEALDSILGLLSPTQKSNLLKLLSSSQISALFQKDIEIIKKFIEGLDDDGFDSEVSVLIPLESPLEDSWYSRENFDYLIKDQEKLDLLLKYAQKDYMQKLLSSSTLLSDLLEQCVLSEPDAPYINTFKDVLSLLELENESSNEIIIALWLSAIMMESGDKDPNTVNALEVLSEQLPQDSFIESLTVDPDVFREFIKVSQSNRSYEFLRDQMRQLKLDLNLGSSEKIINYLWIIALKIEANNEVPNSQNTLTLLSQKLPEESFMEAIIENCSLFLECIQMNQSNRHYHFIWEHINKIDSDQEKYQLLTNTLGFKSKGTYRKVTPLDVLERMEVKPDFYYQLAAFQRKYELIEAARKLNQSKSFADLTIIRSLNNYVDAMNGKPEYFTPLSDIYVDEAQTLTEIISEKGSPDTNEKFEQLVMATTFKPKHALKSSFDLHKSNKEAGDLIEPSDQIQRQPKETNKDKNLDKKKR